MMQQQLKELAWLLLHQLKIKYFKTYFNVFSNV